MRVFVIGTGHVGLVTCSSMAAVGHRVTGVDNDEEKIDALANGRAPFFEPGLQELMQQGLESGRLDFTEAIDGSIAEADVVFICVGTPARVSGEANLLAVERAAQQCVRHLTGGPIPPAIQLHKPAAPDIWPPFRRPTRAAVDVPPTPQRSE